MSCMYFVRQLSNILNRTAQLVSFRKVGSRNLCGPDLQRSTSMLQKVILQEDFAVLYEFTWYAL